MGRNNSWFIDPDKALPLDLILEKAFKTMPPTAQEQLRAMAYRDGISIPELQRRLLEISLGEHERIISDPVLSKQDREETLRRVMPFGPDPLNRYDAGGKQ